MIDSERLCNFEVALLKALEWRTLIHEQSYALYEYEVHSLTRSMQSTLEVLCPTMLAAAASLDPPSAAATPLP